MAVRKPAWDRSLSEIDRLAREVKVENYFKAQQQARADSASSSRADREIIHEMAKNMTADEILAFSAALARGETPNIANYSTARADAASISNGLKMIERLDESNRPHRTFELLPGRTKADTWMRPHMAEPQLMVRINKAAHPPGSPEANAYLARWEQTRNEIATGTYTLPEL